MDFSLHNDYAWLAAGVAFVVLEAVGVSGVGLLFAGLGSVVTGIFLYSHVLANGDYVSQFVSFFAATAVWAGLLWKPLKKFHTSKRGHYRNIVGDTAYVGSAGLSRKAGGEVTWSGTIMRAQLVPGAGVDVMEAGAQVEVVDVAGATLMVKPKE